ncbi:MAG: 50S ribosomal protein L10 [Gemmatimonadota bacterium]
MRLQEKQAVVEELAAKLKDAQAFYLTDFTGLNVKSITDLRTRLRRAGAEYVVVKNTLAERALSGLELPEVSRFFVGPTGLVIGRNDAVTAAKVLREFAKENEDRPTIKVGVVERRAVTPEEVVRIATLPPRDQLLAELAGAMEAPLAQLAYVLQSKLVEFVGLLEALRAERESA